MKLEDLTGQRFGTLFVISYSFTKQGNRYWFCECDCGNYKDVRGTDLKTNKGCGCKRGKHSNRANRLRPFEAIYNRFIRSVSIRGLIVSLSYEDFVEFTSISNCHYCGSLVEWTRFTTTSTKGAYNLDRKDSSIGYTKDNCVVCCARCNWSKSDKFTYEQWKFVGDCMKSRKDLFQ